MTLVSHSHLLDLAMDHNAQLRGEKGNTKLITRLSHRSRPWTNVLRCKKVVLWYCRSDIFVYLGKELLFQTIYHRPGRLFELIRLCGDDQFRRKNDICRQMRYLLHHIDSLSGRCEEEVTDGSIWPLDKNMKKQNRTFVLNFQITVQVRFLMLSIMIKSLPYLFPLQMPLCADGEAGKGEKKACGSFLIVLRAFRGSLWK